MYLPVDSVLGFHNCVADEPVLLRHDDAPLGNRFPTFEGRYRLYLQASKVARTDVWKASRYFERSGTDYQMTQRHLPDKQKAEEADQLYISKHNTTRKCAFSRCDLDSSTKGYTGNESVQGEMAQEHNTVKFSS